MKVTANIDVDAPAQVVWAAITDIQNPAKMISGIISVEILQQPAEGVVGLKWQETRKMFGKEATETMWITEAEENVYYQTRAENSGTVYISRMELDGDGDKCTLLMSFADQPASIFARVMSSVMGVIGSEWMKKLLQQDLQDIKQFVEQR